MASEFWAELTGAVDSIRDVLDDEDRDTETSTFRSDRTVQDSMDLNAHFVLFGSRFESVDRSFGLSESQRTDLLDNFHDRVDPLIKVLHWLTVHAHLQASNSDHPVNTLSTEMKALESAIFFAAVCSLKDYEIEGRGTLVAQLRCQAERSFAEAGLLTTGDITVLQAFVIYLAALRACQANAQQWTLLATAVRRANAQGVNLISDAGSASFDIEQKRQLWFCIGLLDVQSAMDRGCRPMLPSSGFTVFPSTLDDNKLQPRTSYIASSQDGTKYTKSSLSLITYHASDCQRKFTEADTTAPSSQQDSPTAKWNRQLAILAEYEYFVKQVSLGCTTDSPLLQHPAVQVAQQSLVAMRLLLHRPLHKGPQSIAAIDHDFKVLGTATEVLEREKRKRNPKEFFQWSWHGWVKWYALAVVLAELCSNRRDSETERAWKVAQDSYDAYSRLVADTGSGLLWRPIARLMRRAKAVQEGLHRNDVRDDFKTNVPANNGTVPTGMTLHAADEPDMSWLHPLSGGDFDVPMVTEGDAEAMSWFYWDSLIEDMSNQVNFEA